MSRALSSPLTEARASIATSLQQEEGSTISVQSEGLVMRLPELLHSSSVMPAACALGSGVCSPEGCVSSTTSPLPQPSASTGFTGCQRSTEGG
ncbi:hypothetical protein EYF80_055733 [Liparis tanakae]|uniref:Uncharacterized protein n=1 Tax=Liparis tanakae TaxID=230148 RepID=A0A4Z2EZA9_9TELE|nr:hypothetical protein EYF80_055733 [Liparis tanakae]